MKIYTYKESLNLCPLTNIDNLDNDNGDLFWFLNFSLCDYSSPTTKPFLQNGFCSLKCWPDNWQYLMVTSNYYNTVR
jgi:hypothetical protein